MFKNFGKVFKFTFKNSTSSRSYRAFTIIVMLLLLVVPGFIFFVSNKNKEEADKTIESCGTKTVYVVDEYAKDTDFSFLNYVGEDNYSDIKYKTFGTVDEALSEITSLGRKDIFILNITKDSEGNLCADIILPKGTELEKGKARNFLSFIDKSGQFFTISALGLDIQKLSSLNVGYDSEVYTSTGYSEGKTYAEEKREAAAANEEKIEENGLTVRENDAVKGYLPVVRVIFTYANVMLLYFLILSYSNALSQNVVLEKANKLMDTMLVSVKPEALILGKFLGSASAGLLQVLLWVGALIGGVFGGFEVVNKITDTTYNPAIIFIKALSGLGVFNPINIIIGIVGLVAGFLIFMALAAIGGSISSTREEAQANSSLYILILIASFFAVFLCGGLDSTKVVEWLYYVPSIAALMLPAGIITNAISTLQAAISMGLMVLLSTILIIIAGRLYKMMSLYKGNKVNLGKALKMLIANK